MKRTFAALLLIWFSSLAPLRAQSYIDGTANPTAEELTAIKTKIIPRAISVNTTTYVPVKIHLLRNSLGNGGVSLADLQKGFATLNSNFAKSGIQFYMTGNSVHYIDSNDYFEFQSSQETFLVRYDNESESNSAINLYCCELIDYVQGSPYIWARGRYPLDKSYNNRIFVKNDKVADGFAITQAFGHYFGLLSTFGQNRGVRTDETSDGTNCSTAGDLICDTPADPYRSVTDPSAADFSGCSYIGTALDNSGVLFKPVLNNFMSEYSTTCKDRFTTNQSTRMAQGLAERQTHLNYTYSSLPENIVAASNLTATLVDDYILVQWSDNAYNEQGYIIERSEISASAGFVAVQGGGVEANSTQFADKTVKANKDYYYRVRASNSNGNYSNVSSGIRMPLIYCKPTYTTDNCAAGQNLNIKRVAISETGSFSVLDNSSACSPNTGTLNNFSYYSSASTPAVSATLVAGTSYDFSVSTNEYIQHIAVWIDLDRDGSFSESELVFRTIGKQTDYTPRTFTGFKVPTDIKNGESRMRVRSSYGGLTNGEVLDPCASYTYGETEDYQVYLVGGVVDEVPPAFLSSSPSISNQSISGFDLNVSMNEVGKVYFIVVPNGSNATVTAEQVKSGFDAGWQPAMASGSFVVSEALTEFSRTISGLQAGTQYDVFVVGEDNSPTPNLMKLPVKIDAATVFPTAEFSADKKIIYQGQTVQFIDLSTGAGNKWSWNFGDGTLSQLQNPTHTYTTSGKFTIILSINNALSSITKTAYIQVLPKREVPYRLSDGGSFEVNLSDFGTSLIEGSMQLWQHGVPTGTLSELNSPIYGWKTVLAANVPNERNVSALLTPTFNFAADGQYILSFRKSMENAFFDGPYAVQVQYTLDNGASWARLGSYQDPKGTNWYNADPANGFSNTIVADKQGWLGTFANELSTYDASNLALNPNVAFRFVMYVASGFGVNSYVDGFMIDDFEVKYTPPTAEFSSDRVSLFPNESIQFADKSVGATSWYWDFGDGETATSQNPLHTYKIKGTYSVTLVINGKDIYTKRKSNYITVLPDPSVPYSADFEATDNGWKQYAITGDGTKKWEWGTSTAGFFATWGSIDGTKCWTTMLNENHGTNTRYALETPVFSLKKGRGFYYLEFAYRAYCAADPKTNLNKSGMKIEYRLDNGAWKVLGSSLQGQGDVRAIKDWYNTASIDGLGGEFGWYAATSSVFKPRFDITEFVNYGTVQFRFVFGASSLDAAGFQIDNFKIEGNEIAVAGLWVGGYSKNWHDRYNWDNDAVPDANTNVTIQSALYMPLISTDAECKTITVNPGIEITLEKSASLHVYSDMTMYANLQKMATFYNKGGALIVEGITTANKVIYNNIWDLVSLPTSNLAPTFSSATVRRYNEAVSGSWEYM
ncbi:MAG: hypothetical protein RIS47_261, partial [Bacteroidota bacterium]